MSWPLHAYNLKTTWFRNFKCFSAENVGYGQFQENVELNLFNIKNIMCLLLYHILSLLSRLIFYHMAFLNFDGFFLVFCYCTDLFIVKHFVTLFLKGAIKINVYINTTPFKLSIEVYMLLPLKAIMKYYEEGKCIIHLRLAQTTLLSTMVLKEGSNWTGHIFSTLCQVNHCHNSKFVFT